MWGPWDFVGQGPCEVVVVYDRNSKSAGEATWHLLVMLVAGGGGGGAGQCDGAEKGGLRSAAIQCRSLRSP